VNIIAVTLDVHAAFVFRVEVSMYIEFYSSKSIGEMVGFSAQSRPLRTLGREPLSKMPI
jgi:hypothetical protein